MSRVYCFLEVTDNMIEFKYWKFNIIFNILCLSCVKPLFAECPLYQVSHTVDAMTVCCKPVFICDQGHEVQFCTNDGGNDMCVPCDEGAVNWHKTSSLDTKRHTCFKMNESHKDCPDEEAYPTVENDSCNEMFCRCKIEECRFGDVCLRCLTRSIPCNANEELNSITGECEPCGDLKYSGPGCGQCMYNETAWRLRQEQLGSKNSVYPPKVTTKITLPVVTKEKPSEEHGGTEYHIATGSPSSNMSTEQSQAKEEGDLSIILVIIIIAVIVSIGVTVALVLFIKKKIRNGDRNSRLVVLYNKLIPCRRQDEEAVHQNGVVAHNEEEEGRRVQEVRPFNATASASAAQSEEEAGCSEGAACSPDMVLLKEGQDETRKKAT